MVPETSPRLAHHPHANSGVAVDQHDRRPHCPHFTKPSAPQSGHPRYSGEVANGPVTVDDGRSSRNALASPLTVASVNSHVPDGERTKQATNARRVRPHARRV